MNLKSEIKSQIFDHLNKFGLTSNVNFSTIVDDIIISVTNGNTAFQLIYDETFTLIDWKVLNRYLIKSLPGVSGGLIFSYDGGKRYQWSKEETLLIDMRLIREYKLNEILR